MQIVMGLVVSPARLAHGLAGPTKRIVDPTPTTPGSPSWALDQLRAGRRVRKTNWGMGCVYLHPRGHLTIHLGDGNELAVSESFLSIDYGTSWRWEIDTPRRFSISFTTRADLAVLPTNITVGQLAQAIDRCRSTDNNFDALIASAWQTVGDPATGRRILDFLNSTDGYVAVLAARANHDREALPSLLKTLEELKGAAR